MQPRNLADDAALVELDVELDVAVLWLLPQPAITSVADTASAAVAHALCFTLTSTRPGAGNARPRDRPEYPGRLCLVVSAGKGTHDYASRSLPNRNPFMMALLAYRTDRHDDGRTYFVLSYRLTMSWTGRL
jgi:hypothetical protein